MSDATIHRLLREVTQWRRPPGDKHKRLGIPKEILRTSELAATGLPVSLLQTQLAPGILTLRPAAFWEQKIRPRIETALADENFETAFLLNDRYELITLGKDARPTLTLEVAAHLGMSSLEEPHLIYFEAIPRLIRVMSQTYRNDRLLRFPEDRDTFV